MASLGIFIITFISCIMSALGAIGLKEIDDDESRLFFGTSSAATGGTATGGATNAQITGWETTLIVGVAFAIVFIIWMFLIFGLPSDASPIASASAHTASVFDPFAVQHHAATGHHAPTAFAGGHHAPASHHAVDSDLHSSYSFIRRALEEAARKYR